MLGMPRLKRFKRIEGPILNIENFRSGALPGKMLLVRSIENNKLMLILGQVRLSKGKLCPAGLGKGLG